jgi:hypothetical protein
MKLSMSLLLGWLRSSRNHSRCIQESYRKLGRDQRYRRRDLARFDHRPHPPQQMQHDDERQQLKQQRHHAPNQNVEQRSGCCQEGGEWYRQCYDSEQRQMRAMLYGAATGGTTPAPASEYVLVSAIDAAGQAWVEIDAGVGSEVPAAARKDCAAGSASAPAGRQAARAWRRWRDLEPGSACLALR